MAAAPAPPAGLDALTRRFALTPEQASALEAYVALLAKWSPKINLVGASTLDDPWRRHIWDAAQVADLLPDTADTLIDMGSGAGLPGLILAVLCNVAVHSIESDGRKTAFQRQAVQQMGLREKVVLHNNRVEACSGLSADIITARAFAPLQKLLQMGYGFSHSQTLWVLPKGQNLDAELKEATKCWTFHSDTVHSETDVDARILCLREVKPK
ncbi:MAG: 16S rRNA (guanine(527)-N(7))-methyltransferase RsmG [Sphingomonadales bacterium]